MFADEAVRAARDVLFHTGRSRIVVAGAILDGLAHERPLTGEFGKDDFTARTRIVSLKNHEAPPLTIGDAISVGGIAHRVTQVATGPDATLEVSVVEEEPA